MVNWIVRTFHRFQLQHSLKKFEAVTDRLQKDSLREKVLSIAIKVIQRTQKPRSDILLNRSLSVIRFGSNDGVNRICAFLAVRNILSNLDPSFISNILHSVLQDQDRCLILYDKTIQGLLPLQKILVADMAHRLGSKTFYDAFVKEADIQGISEEEVLRFPDLEDRLKAYGCFVREKIDDHYPNIFKQDKDERARFIVLISSEQTSDNHDKLVAFLRRVGNSEKERQAFIDAQTLPEKSRQRVLNALSEACDGYRIPLSKNRWKKMFEKAFAVGGDSVEECFIDWMVDVQVKPQLFDEEMKQWLIGKARASGCSEFAQAIESRSVPLQGKKMRTTEEQWQAIFKANFNSGQIKAARANLKTFLDEYQRQEVSCSSQMRSFLLEWFEGDEQSLDQIKNIAKS